MSKKTQIFDFNIPSSDPDEQELGTFFRPKFNDAGLVTCVTVDAYSKAVLMVAFMNQQALSKTLETGEAWYWSRSRNELWHKGATSGQIQKVVSLKTDCDQDALLLEVRVEGDGGCCHTGHENCFYRTVTIGNDGILTLVE